MKLAALFSGGKDSTYAILAAQRLAHTITCLVTIHPLSDASHLLHYPDIKHTTLQAKAMSLPHLISASPNTNADTETSTLRDSLVTAKNNYGIQGIVHGGIKSNFQKNNFEKVCNDLNLHVVSPLWDIDQTKYMHQLLDDNFEFILTSVTTDGLDDTWLGRPLTRDDLYTLEKLSSKYKFNISFEGGEAETFVLNCPLFSKQIIIKSAKKTWDGYRGRFEIQEVELDNHA